MFSTLRRWFTLACTLLATCSLVQAAVSQAPPASSTTREQAVQIPKFDVISVRETKGIIISESLRADGYYGVGVNLLQLIMEAYGIPQFDRILRAPEWRIDKRFDVQAKVDDPNSFSKISAQEERAMLKQVLAERFHLAIHEEQQEQPVYHLISMGKLGPSIQRVELKDPTDISSSLPVIRRSRRGQLTAEQFTIARFANQLSGIAHRDVVDQTNLGGLFNIELTWDPDYGKVYTQDATNSSGSESPQTGSSIFTALEDQLGLKLTNAKGQVKVWVIDHVELPDSD